MSRWHVIVGVIVGLATAWGLGRWAGPPAPHAVTHGPMLAEFGPAIREVVVHHVRGSRATMDVIGEYLRRADEHLIAYVVCPDRETFDEFAAGVAPVRCRLVPVVVHHPITAWSRDRWTVLLSARAGDPLTLLRPHGEAAAGTWPARAGDERVAADLARHPLTGCTASTSPLLFDGGDLLADDRHVFVSRGVLARNLGAAVGDERRLIEQLTADLGRPAVVLARGPDHHAGMFMMSLGEGVAIVGDPALGNRLLAGCTAPPRMPGSVDDSPQTQAEFDSVAARLESLGYRVVRVPTVVGRGTKAYLTYVNVLMDRDRATGAKVVYLPTYRGAEPLNDSARAVWEREGFIVRPIDCTDVFPHFGTLHCLVNVLRRG